jgi:hypothetical protein
MRQIRSEGQVNVLTLARTAGTSVDQIEWFYARRLPISPESRQEPSDQSDHDCAPLSSHAGIPAPSQARAAACRTLWISWSCRRAQSNDIAAS